MSNSPTTAATWWSDDPIDRLEDDHFGRRDFISHATKLIQQVGTQASSTVIGLVGPWGSGKTSSMRLILAGLPTEVWRMTWIYPWALSGADAMVGELLGGIKSALPGGPATKARQALARYGKYATPALTFVPVVGDPLKEAAGYALNKAGSPGTLTEQMTKAEKALRELRQPVLVVLDDLDRLQPDQLLGVFRAIRVIGRLPYVHYLVAYDHQTLLDVLCATPIANHRVDRAVAFLEKIINLPLDQPPIQPEHAHDLLTSGINATLAAAGAIVSEEVSIRLASELETLLRLLTEPRALSRLVSQLRIYLPLVGASEVDVVDFLALTHIRLTHPLLYRALAADRVELTTVFDSESRDTTVAKYNIKRLQSDFHVPETGAELMLEMLHRLFPVLDVPFDERSRSGRERKRECRASDPDHVGRYFALAAINDFTMAQLTTALGELRHGTSGPGTHALSTVLRPNLEDRSAVAVAARVLRRAEVLTDDATPAEASALLLFLVDMLPELVERQSDRVGTEAAAVAWLARLLSVADRPGPSELVAKFDTSPTQPTRLPLLIQGIKLRPTTGRATAASAVWHGELTQATAVAALKRFLDNAQLGDEATQEPVALLLRWAEEVVGAADVDRQLGEAVDRGIAIPAIAARLVDIGTVYPGNRSTILDFDAGAFIERLAYDRIIRARPEIEMAAEPTGELIDSDDVTWRNRRRVAASVILEVLETEQRDPGALLPVVPQPMPNVFQAANLNIVNPLQVTTAPEVVLQARFLLPRGSSRTLPPTKRDDLIIEALTKSPLTSWLIGEATTDRSLWQITETAGRWAAELTGIREMSAHLAKAQLVDTMLTLAVRLTPNARPALATLYPLLSATVRSSETANEVHRLLSGSKDRINAVPAQVTLFTRIDLDKAFQLGHLRRRGSSQRSEYTATLLIGTGKMPRDNAAAAVLHFWLSDAGYAGYERSLYNLWRPRPDHASGRLRAG